MKISRKISLFVILGAFLIGTSLGVSSLISLYMNQTDNLNIAKNEILETSRELTKRNAEFFFRLLDIKLEKNTASSIKDVLQAIPQIDPDFANNVVVIYTKKRAVIKGYNGFQESRLINQRTIDNFIDQNMLRHKGDFYLDNDKDFLKDKKGNITPILIQFHIYDNLGLIIGYGKAMQTAKIRIEFMKIKTRSYLKLYLLFSFLIGAISTVIVVVGSIYLMIRSFIRPLEEINKGVSSISLGQLNTRIKIPNKDEIGALAASINKMAKDLEGSTISINDLNNEIVERQQIEHDLRQSKEILARKALESNLLFEITKKASQKNSSTEALQGCLKDICEFTSWPIGHIYTFTEGNDKSLISSKIWFINESMGDLTDFKKRSEELVFTLGAGFAGKTWATGEPAWVPDIIEHHDFTRGKELNGINIKGLFALPIKIQHEIVAVAEFFSNENFTPNEDFMGTARSIAEQMGRVIERKRAERDIASAQAQLFQSEKLASIGQLAAGVAHEINNPVGFINNNMELLRQYVTEYTEIIKMVEGLKKSVANGDIQKTKEILNNIDLFEKNIQLDKMINDSDSLFKHNQKGIERIQKIVMDLRTFAHEDNDTMEFLKIEEIIDSILSIVHHELKFKAELKKDYGKTPLVKCNSQRMGQVFINLLINAVQAMDKKGVIEVKTYQKDDFLCIEITDTGQGIPPENLSKIFDAFFTTKPIGQGTGLGLSVSYEIVKKHGGDIQVQSEVGKGTKFTVILPLK